MSRFILASNSPRRKELLTISGFDFDVVPSDVDERLPDGIEPDEATMTLAERKCLDVLEKRSDCVVLGCDTVVSIGGKILGKPKSEQDAFDMLMNLSGREHTVFSGVCIASGSKKSVFCNSAKVKFYDLSENMIRSYIETGEPMDKAGAYGIQAYGASLVEKIDGDYFTIVGLPLARCVRVLADFDIYGALRLN